MLQASLWATPFAWVTDMRAAIKVLLAFVFSGHRVLLVLMIGILSMSIAVARSLATEPATLLRANFSQATPRAVEELTQHSILRDYGHAWDTLANALNENDGASLNAYFAGAAKTQMEGAIESQKRTGIRTEYLSPSHTLDAVFYAPEGDLMELHDTIEVEVRVSANQKTIHDERVVLRYVVLMTPAADRWVVRQLQAVAQF